MRDRARSSALSATRACSTRAVRDAALAAVAREQREVEREGARARRSPAPRARTTRRRRASADRASAAPGSPRPPRRPGRGAAPRRPPGREGVSHGLGRPALHRAARALELEGDLRRRAGLDPEQELELRERDGGALLAAERGALRASALEPRAVHLHPARRPPPGTASPRRSRPAPRAAAPRRRARPASARRPDAPEPLADLRRDPRLRGGEPRLRRADPGARRRDPRTSLAADLDALGQRHLELHGPAVPGLARADRRAGELRVRGEQDATRLRSRALAARTSAAALRTSAFCARARSTAAPSVSGSSARAAARRPPKRRARR